MDSGRSWPVVAGVDFSPQGDRAVEFAAREAERRGLELRLVHGLVAPIPSLTPFPALYADQETRARAENELAEFARALASRHPGLVITAQVVIHAGATALIDESGRATVLIIGARRRGRLSTLLAGSVAGQIATYATCPVIVVAGPARAEGNIGPGPVVAGVDGSEHTNGTLRFALDEAARRGSTLIAVQVWGRSEDGLAHHAAQQVLSAALAEWHRDFPGVKTEHRTLLSDRPVQALLEICDQTAAALLVVGSRGHGGFTGPLLGSVSQSLVAHAGLPVAVVHPHPAATPAVSPIARVDRRFPAPATPATPEPVSHD